MHIFYSSFCLFVCFFEDVIVNNIEGKVSRSNKADRNNNDDDEDDAIERQDKSHSSSPQFQVREKTLAEMRDVFQDRLADFHCLSKNVFEVELERNCEHQQLLSVTDLIISLLLVTQQRH